MSSLSDRILATRPIGETYMIESNGHRLHFRKEGNNQYQDLNKQIQYSSAGEILRQQSFEVHGHRNGVSNRPDFIKITSGPDISKTLNMVEG